MSAEETPEIQLRALIERLDPDRKELVRAVRTALRKRLPTTNELVYEYADQLVVAYTPTEKPMEAIVSFAARADGLRLYFSQGPRLPDPKKLLLGSGTQVRFIPVEAAGRLAHPDVEALFVAAIEKAPMPLPATGGGRVIVKPTTASKRAGK